MNDPLINLDDYDTTNVIPFARPAHGGSGPPDAPKGDWLRQLQQGTRFLARRKGTTGSALEDFVVATDPKKMEVVLLGQNRSGVGELVWHESVLFSKDYKLIYTLEVIKNDDNQLVHQGPVERPLEPEELSPVHETE